MKKTVFLLLYFTICISAVLAVNTPVYVLNETTVSDVYNEVKQGVAHCDDLEVRKEIRGVIISIHLEHPEENYYRLTPEIVEKLSCIEYFLAKIKNPVIIEVHTDRVPEGIRMKNWEYSSVIAAKVGDMFIHREPKIPAERIYPVGYGEFMPDINTSNNGGNNNNRIDIIIQSSISGE